MYVDDDQKPIAALSLRVYGASAGAIRKDIDSIMGLAAGNNPVKSHETGLVEAKPEIYSSARGMDCSGCGTGGGGGGEAELVCFIIIAIVMAIFALVWAAVMIVFSIVTLGGFIKRRFRSLVLVEKVNTEFLGKLSVLAIRRDSVFDYHFGHPQYDDWVDDTFGIFMTKKYVRQIAMVLGFGWGLIEIAYKIPNLLNPDFHYDLWPLRFVMILIFTPLILYSPFLEWKFRGAFNLGDEMVTRLLHEYPSFSPDTPMQFGAAPRVITTKPQFSVEKTKKQEPVVVEKEEEEKEESDSTLWD